MGLSSNRHASPRQYDGVAAPNHANATRTCRNVKKFTIAFLMEKSDDSGPSVFIKNCDSSYIENHFLKRRQSLFPFMRPVQAKLSAGFSKKQRFVEHADYCE